LFENLTDNEIIACLLQTRYSELFAGPCAKVKGTIYAEVEPSSSNLRWEEQFSRDLMDNPR